MDNTHTTLDFKNKPGLFLARISQGVLACILAFSLSCSFAPDIALADVRKADIVLGETIDSRGLSVAQCPNIDAEYAIAMNGDGTIYFERNATAPAQIASITKIMTALVAIEAATPETQILVSERAATVGESSAYLETGDQLDFDAALKALMLSSGNDAAIAIAESIGAALSGGSATGIEAEQVFVDRMNEKATELGLLDTVFSNPHGLDNDNFASDQHSCALDVATIAKAAMQYSIFRDVVAMSEATIALTHADGSAGSTYLESTNFLLGSYEGNIGIKTGHTNLAGFCFAGVSNRGDQDLYTVVLHAADESTRFGDTQSLCDWVYEHYISYALAHSPQKTTTLINGQSIEVPIVAEVAHIDWIDKTIKATLAEPSQEIKIFDLSGNISQSVEYETVSGDVKVGDKVGTLTFKQRNKVIATVDMISCEDINAPSLFEGVGIWWDRLFRGFSGKATVAVNTLINETPLISTKQSTE